MLTPAGVLSSLIGIVHIFMDRTAGLKGCVFIFINSLCLLLANQEATGCWTFLPKTNHQYSICQHLLVLQLYRRESTSLDFKNFAKTFYKWLRYQ